MNRKEPRTDARVGPNTRWASPPALVLLIGLSALMLVPSTVIADQSAEVAPEAAIDADGSSRLAHGGHGGWWTSRSDYKSPGLAVALSLTPLPVDFGNLYAENVDWALGYTVAQLSVATPLIWLTARHMGGPHRHHGPRERNDAPTWSETERRWGYGLLTGYVVIKLISATHAAFAARAFNQAHEPEDASLNIAAMDGGPGLVWTLQF